MAQQPEIESPEEDPSTMLREGELARRWDVSQRTLQRLRTDGQGPAFIRIGGAIRYQMADVLAYDSLRRVGEIR